MALCAACILIFARPGFAQTLQRDTILARGTFTLQSFASYAAGLEQRNEDLSGVMAGGGYFVRDNLSLNLELSVARAVQTGGDAWMGGLAGTVRHHLLLLDGGRRGSIFADAGFGPVWADDRVPHDGTNLNFITRVGLGGTIALCDDLHWMLGVRYFHLSNARIDGVERNPGINGVECYTGLMWLIR